MSKCRVSAMSSAKLDRLRAAHAKVAQLVMMDIVYLPIFRRLEAELAAEEARTKNDAIAYARAAMAIQEQAAKPL